MPRKKHIHTAKFRRCVAKCKKKKKRGKPRSCYAVCTKSLGYKKSVLARSRRKGKKRKKRA